MTKKNISANLYRKCMILSSKIVLNVPHNFSLIVLLPWQHTGFQNHPILKAFHIFKWCLIYMIQQAYKYVSLSLWPCLTFFRLKITYKVNGYWERMRCHGNKMFYSRRCVLCRTISLPIFNGLRCKLAKIALFKYMIRSHSRGRVFLHNFSIRNKSKSLRVQLERADIIRSQREIKEILTLKTHLSINWDHKSI